MQPSETGIIFDMQSTGVCRMNRAFILLAVAFFIAMAGSPSSADSVAYTKLKVSGVPVHVVTVNLNDPDVSISPALARNGIGSSEGFGSMLSRLKPSAAITGTYFCTRSMIPVGRIIVDGQLMAAGSVGTAVCFTSQNRVDFRSRKEFKKIDWSQYPYVISSGPRLVRNGIAGVYPRAEGFRDGGLFRKARRSALGLTGKNKLLLVTVDKPIYLGKLAKIMKQLGAQEAVNLDGGSSTALHYQGKAFSHPGRRLTNLIVVYESPTRFAKIKPRLAPSPVIAERSGSRG